MALQIRRGTNKERLQITPAEGELIYVTDYELVTISASANVSTNVLTSVAHGLITNQQVRFQDTTKNGLTLNQVYYVASTPDPDTFTLKTTLNGSTLDITGTYTTPLIFAKTPTNAAGAPLGINVTALWIGDGDTVGGVPGNTQGLDDLTDVTITTPAEGNTLYYDATTQQWKNTNILNIDDVTGTQNIYVNGTGTSTIKAINANTNLGFAPLEVFSRTTATPVNGFGSSIKFIANNAVGTDKLLGYANFNYDDITTGSEDAGLSIVLMENGVSPAYPSPGTVAAQLTLDSTGNLRVRGDLTLNSDNGNNQSTINFNHPTANGTITWQGTGHFLSGDLVVNGGTDGTVVIDTPAGGTSIANIFNGAIGTINMGNGPDNGTLGYLNLGNPNTGSIVTIKSPTTNVNGALTVTGNLTVNGTTTTVNSTTMTVDDPNLVLNAVGTPSDANANLGGITVNGTTNKQLYWNNADKRWYFDNGTGGQVDGAMKMVVDLTDIRNVETTAFNKGQMFYFDGTNWINGSNIKFNNMIYRPQITTEVNLNDANEVNSGGVNTALRLVKDTLATPFTDGAGTGIIMSVDSDSQARIDVIRLLGQYNSAGAHDASIVATTTNNSTYVELYRASKDRTNINNGVLYVNATNGRVGINNTTPNTTLDISGNLYTSSTIQSATNITAGSNIFGGVDLLLAGSSVVLKNGFTGAPNSDAGFLVERGNETDATWKWVESLDSWNTNYNIIADGAITAVGALGTNGLNIIFNNEDATPGGSDHANLLVKRGGGVDVILRWNETTDRWQTTSDGSTYITLPNQNLDIADTPTFAGVNAGNISIGTSNNNYIRSETGQLVLQSVTGSVSIDDDLSINGLLTATSAEITGTGNITFSYNDSATPRGILGQMSNGAVDYWFVGGAESGGALNAGELLLATGDDGNDPIRVRQYTGNPLVSTTYRQLTLMDANGHTGLAGDLTLAGNGYIYSSTGLALHLTGGQVKTGSDLLVGSNVIKSANGTTALTLQDTTGHVTVAGDLFVAGNGIFSLGGYQNLQFTNSNVEVIGNLQVGSGNISSTAGVLQLTSPATNHIKLTPGTTGNVYLESSTIVFGDTSGTLGAQLTTNGAGDLRLDTNNNNTSGYINIATGTNGAITISPHGTGSTNITSALAVTGNLTVTGNTIKKSSGTDVITFSGTNLTTFAGDIKLGGNTVYDSAGNNVLDFKTLSSIYGTSYQAKFNTSVNYGLSASYLLIDNIVEINTSSLTTTSTSTAVLDYFDPASYRSAKYLIQITNGSSHQIWEGMMIHDGTNIFISAYGDLRTGANLATVSAAFNVSTGYPELRVTPVNATQTKFKATKTYIAV